MSFTTDLVAGFAQLLADGGIGLTWHADGSSYAADVTGIHVAAVPQDPARIVVLTPYPLSDDPTLADSEVGLQVRSRSVGADPRDVFDLDDAIAGVLLGNYPLTLSTGVRVHTLVRSSATPLGQDDRQRWEWSSNYTVGAYHPAPHRL